MFFEITILTPSLLHHFFKLARKFFKISPMVASTFFYHSPVGFYALPGQLTVTAEEPQRRQRLKVHPL
jgi:hypothetical protein